MFRHPASGVRILFKYALFCRRIGMLLLFGLSSLCASSAFAQNGSFLESLFRSIAEKKLQETRERSGQPPAPLPIDDTATTRIPGRFPGGPLGPSTIVPSPERRRNPSQEVREFQAAIAQFQDQLNELMQTIQPASRTNRDFRAQLPALYQLQADVNVLAARARSAASVDPLLAAYQDIDQRYRELSFRLRSVPDRDQSMRSIISRCDSSCRTLGKLSGISPQFDRHGLHDQMLIAATYLQTLIDDLPTARMPSDQSRALIHEARLLRQTILQAADQLPNMSYDEIVSNFTNFVARWRPFAESLATVRDSVLDRRLARVNQCGDEVYALLWMAPPPSSPLLDGRPASSVLESDRERWMSDAASLEGTAEYFYADLRRYERALRPADYSRSVINNARELYESAREIHSELDAGQPLPRLQRSAARLATAWRALASDLEVISQRGLSTRQALALQQQQQQMLSPVASLTAAFLQDEWFQE